MEVPACAFSMPSANGTSTAPMAAEISIVFTSLGLLVHLILVLLPKLVLRRLLDVIDHNELHWNLRALQMETQLFFQSLRYRRGELSRLLASGAPHPAASWSY